MDPKALHALGQAGSSEAFAAVAAVDSPSVTRNVAREYAEAHVSESGAVAPPTGDGPLALLWDGDVEAAHRQADTDLAILLEVALGDVALGLVAQPANRYADAAL